MDQYLNHLGILDGEGLAFADPVNNVGVSYVMNQMEDNVKETRDCAIDK